MIKTIFVNVQNLSFIFFSEYLLALEMKRDTYTHE